MEFLETDVLIIGSGLAGLRAAIEAARNGANTMMVSKSSIETGSNSALAGGGLSVGISEKDIEEHVGQTLQIGQGLNDRQLLTELSKRGKEAIEFLTALGVDLDRKPPYRFSVYKPGQSEKIFGGRILTGRLARECLRYSQIRFLPHFFVYRLIGREGQASGAVGFNKDGKPCIIHSRAVILATGGGGAIYARNDNHKRMTGDGYALALEAELPLVDMEFVQFYPFGFAEPGLPSTLIYPPYPELARIVDDEGNDFVAKHGLEKNLDKLVITRRDELTHLVYKASQTGKVFMDYTQVPEEAWKAYPLNMFPQQRFAFREKPFRIAPITHFFMGGVKIKPSGETEMKGLFAAGEIAGGLHGANRMGGNALAECFVFGANSGLSASVFAKRQTSKKVSFDLRKWLASLIHGKPNPRIQSELRSQRRKIQNIAWKFAGPIREEGSLKRGLSLLEATHSNLKALRVSTSRELIQKKEVENSLLVTKAIVVSSLARRESRGAFRREDYLHEGGDEFLKRTSVKMKRTGQDLTVTWEDLG
jgi:succinate dehydrogenase/fumarate reductase flavoprotein subunit